MGTFTRKTLPQKKCASRKPPSVGPTMIPTPATPDHAAMAWARSRGGNTAFRIESVAGITKAAPRPMRTRSAMSTFALVANAATRLPIAKTIRPPTSERRRP